MTDIPPKPPIVDDAMIAQARADLGGFFDSTIEALRQDMQARLKASQIPPSETSKAINEFTEQMIALLAARVKDALPNPQK
jgi:hypothetical protein